jgi:hypothetical protein
MNNLKLTIQPYIFYCLIRPGLEGFNLKIVGLGLCKLIHYLNEFRTLVNEGVVMDLVTLRACYILPKATKEQLNMRFRCTTA